MMSWLASRRRLAASAGVLALVAAALALRLGFFGGLVGWDDVDYIDAAKALRHGDYVVTSTFRLRYALTVPLALSQAWIGETRPSHALVPLVYSTAHLVLAYLLGTLYGGVSLGILAGALLAILPLDVVAATDLHADLPVSVFMAAAVYAVARGELASGRPRYWFFAGGVALGLAFLAKEVALALVVVLGGLAWAHRRRFVLLTPYAWLALGLLLVVMADMAWMTVTVGHPLYRYSRPAAEFHLALMRAVPPGRGWMLGYTVMLLNPFAPTFGYFAGIFYLVLGGTVWGLRRRQAIVAGLTIWWATLFVLFNFAPFDRTFTRPLFHHFARTLHPLCVPFVIITALWLRDALEGRRVLRAAVVGAFSMLAIAGIWATHFDQRQWAAVARQAAPVIDRFPNETVVIGDGVTIALLRVLRPHRADRLFVYGQPGSPRSGPMLVLRDPRFLSGSSRAPGAPPPEVFSPPRDWERVGTFARPRRPSLRGALRELLGQAQPRSIDEPASLWKVPRLAPGDV